MKELFKFLLIGIILQLARGQYYQQQIATTPFIYQNAGFASPNLLPQAQTYPMQPVQYQPLPMHNMNYQNPQISAQQPIYPVPRTLNTDIYSQPVFLQSNNEGYLKGLGNDIQTFKTDMQSNNNIRDNEALRFIKESLDRNDKQHIDASSMIMVDTLMDDKKKNLPRKAMDTDMKKMKLLRVFKNYLSILKHQRISNRDLLIQNFNDYFKDDKEFYTKNFLDPVIKNFNINKNKINFRKMEEAIVKKLISVDVNDARLQTISKLPKISAKVGPKKQHLKFFKHVKKALKKRGLSLPKHFYKNYNELKRMAKLYEYKLKHPKAKKRFAAKLNKFQLNPKQFNRKLKEKTQFFLNFQGYYNSLKKNLKTKKIEHMMGRIQRILSKINADDYGIVYVRFLEGYSQRHIDGNNITSNQSRDLNNFLDSLIIKYEDKAYLSTIFKIFKSFKQFGNIHFDNKDKTIITFDLFMQYFKNKIKQGEQRFLLHNYFERFFKKFEEVKGTLMAKYPDLKDQIIFDYAKFLSELYKHYTFDKFMRLNKILSEFDNQLAKVIDPTDEKYKNFIAELNKIFFAIFKEFLIIRNSEPFINFSTYYLIPPEAYPNLENHHIQNEDSSYHEVPNSKNTIIHDENPGQSELLERGDVDGILSNITEAIDKISHGKDGNVEELQPVYNKLDQLIKNSYPNFIGRYKTIVDRIIPHTVNANVESTPDVKPIQVTLNSDHNSKTGGVISNLTADFSAEIGPQKQVKINMKVIKKGRMVTRLLFEFLKDNSSHENSALIETISQIKRDIDPEINDKLNFLYETLDIYTKRFETLLNAYDLIHFKDFWKVFVIFYSKNCYLILYKKVIKRLADTRKAHHQLNFKNLKTILSNLILFLKSNKKYNFKAECDQLSKLITMKKRLTMFKLKKLNIFHMLKKALFRPVNNNGPFRPTGNNTLRPHVYLRKRNKLTHWMKKTIDNGPRPNFRRDDPSRPHNDESESEDQPNKNRTKKRFNSTLKHTKYNKDTIVRKKTIKGTTLFKKVIDDNEKTFNKVGRSHLNPVPSDDPEDEPEDDPTPKNNDKTTDSDLKFIKELIISTMPQTLSHSSIDATNKLLYVNLKPKFVSYFKYLKQKYGDAEQALQSKKGLTIFNKLNKLFYKKNPKNVKNFKLFTKQLLKELYKNHLKNKMAKGGDLSTEKLIYKPRLDTNKKLLLKVLFNKFSNIDTLKKKGLGNVVFDQLNKVLFKPLKKKKDIQLLFNTLRANYVNDSANTFDNAGTLIKTYIKSQPDIESEQKLLPPVKNIEPEQKMCKIVKHCKQRCYKIIDGQKLEITPDDPLYQHSVCGRDEQSGEEEVPCNRVGEPGSKQINLNPLFFMNIEVDTTAAKEDVFNFLRKADFIKKLAEPNEIDIDEYKRDIAGIDTQKSFKLDLKPFKGTDEVSKDVREIRGRISDSSGQTNYPIQKVKRGLWKGASDVPQNLSRRRSNLLQARYYSPNLVTNDRSNMIYDHYDKRKSNNLKSDYLFKSQRFLKDDNKSPISENKEKAAQETKSEKPYLAETQKELDKKVNKLI